MEMVGDTFNFELPIDNLQNPMDQARSIYSNQALVSTAAAVIYTHPRAIEYLRTAPVLILGASYGKTFRRSAEFAQISNMFARQIDKGPKLKDLLLGYGIAPQMRAVGGKCLSPNKHKIIQEISRYIKPSPLAQAIPQKSFHQHLWLYACDRWWTRHVHVLAEPNSRAPNFEWAVTRLNQFTQQEQLTVVGDLLDFARNPANRFDEKWTFDQAIEAMQRWHVALGKMDASQRFKSDHGIEYKEEFQYKNLPNEVEISGMKISAVNSGEKLYLEGRAMHHCVSTYTRPCISGRYAVFSITGERGKRLATLGYRREGDYWIFDQLKGPCNKLVPAPVHAAANNFTVLHVRKNKQNKN